MKKTLVCFKNVKNNSINENPQFLKYSIMSQDKYIIVNKRTILLIDIQCCIDNKNKKIKDRDKVITTFGIKNDNFCAISTDDFFERDELLYLFNLLEKIANNQFIEKEISFINERLKFDFFIPCKKEQCLDIKFEFIKKERDTYILSLTYEEIKSLYNMLFRQINIINKE